VDEEREDLQAELDRVNLELQLQREHDELQREYDELEIVVQHQKRDKALRIVSEWLAQHAGFDDHKGYLASFTLSEKISNTRAFAGKKRNGDWKPLIVPLRELLPSASVPTMEFCLVPPGTFQMGSDSDSDTQPIHPQMFTEAYWIAQYPVTNAQWRAGVQAGAVSKPTNTGWYNDPNMADCPVVYVSWLESQKYAAWLGLCLPTEAEWEYAARGVESWTYPWGNDWEDGNRLVWSENGSWKPNPVTSKPEGASWVGALHLSGNVWEWTSSLRVPYPYKKDKAHDNNTGRVLRGDSFSSGRDDAGAVSRFSGYDVPNDGYVKLGFRLLAPL